MDSVSTDKICTGEIAFHKVGITRMFFCKCIPFCSQASDQTLESHQTEISWRFGTFFQVLYSLPMGNAQVHYPVLEFLLYSFQESTTSAQAHCALQSLFQESSGGVLLTAVSLGLPQRTEFLFVLKKLMSVLSPTCQPLSHLELPSLVNVLTAGRFQGANSPWNSTCSPQICCSPKMFLESLQAWTSELFDRLKLILSQNVINLNLSATEAEASSTRLDNSY